VTQQKIIGMKVGKAEKGGKKVSKRKKKKLGKRHILVEKSSDKEKSGVLGWKLKLEEEHSKSLLGDDSQNLRKERDYERVLVKGGRY